ncbi:MAG TPA: VOC family protein [Povalibacter sp.]|nr:VOC family protein [Povalibacter sp.]
MITHVKFVGIPVRDQQAQLRFYTEKLGFEILTDQPLGAQRWIELRIPRAQTSIVLFTPEGHESRVGSFFNGSLACDNVQKTYETLRSRGVEFTQPPTSAPWGSYAKFKDVEGNEFVLSER